MENNEELKGWTIPVLDKGYVRLIDWHGSDQRVLEFARISYGSSSKGDEADKKLIEYLWKNRHSSPFEAIKITLNIKMPIFVMRQYVRHRMQNLNEVSARYSELPEEFYIPKAWRPQDTKNKQGSIATENWNPLTEIYEDKSQMSATRLLEEHSRVSYETYQALLDAGVSREMARMVLPVNIYTEIYTTWDMKNLLHFITLREDSHAQAEIVEYAKAIKEMCEKLFPWVMTAFSKYKFQLVEI